MEVVESNDEIKILEDCSHQNGRRYCLNFHAEITLSPAMPSAA